jgi:hypothetical protein
MTILRGAGDTTAARWGEADLRRSGRGRALVELIAEVNPTGRELAPSEQARRYAGRSALQSSFMSRGSPRGRTLPHADTPFIALPALPRSPSLTLPRADHAERGSTSSSQKRIA